MDENCSWNDDAFPAGAERMKKNDRERKEIL